MGSLNGAVNIAKQTQIRSFRSSTKLNMGFMDMFGGGDTEEEQKKAN